MHSIGSGLFLRSILYKIVTAVHQHLRTILNFYIFYIFFHYIFRLMSTELLQESVKKHFLCLNNILLRAIERLFPSAVLLYDPAGQGKNIICASSRSRIEKGSLYFCVRCFLPFFIPITALPTSIVESSAVCSFAAWCLHDAIKVDHCRSDDLSHSRSFFN